MKTLILANAFKGSLSSSAAGKIMQKNIKGPSRVLLISDGGDGILEVFKTAYPSSKIKYCRARDAYGVCKKAPFLVLPGGKTAVIETAKICGLGGIARKDLKPLISSSFGVGEVIKYAAGRGIKNFYAGLGGVACNDGGAGMAAALGVKFDAPARTGALRGLKNIDAAGLKLKGLKFYALTDVTNPLLGKNGSAAVYGPQKCKTEGEVKIISAALKNYAKVIKKCLGADVSRTPGAGAAGAIAAGMFVFLNAEFKNGAEFAFEKLNIEKEIKSAGRVIITEGRLDAQTFMGKAPGRAVKLAQKYGKEIIFICGRNEVKNKLPFKIIELQKFAKDEKDSLSNAAKLLSLVSKTIK